jgi:amino acid efflux transporter
VLGPRAASAVPLADLLHRAIGPAGTAAAAAAAIILTLGAVNAYVTGAATMARQLTGNPHRGEGPAPRFLATIAAAGLLLITLYGLGLVSTAALVAVPTALFLFVYLGCMTAAARVLRGPARAAAIPATLAVAVMLAFCGWALAVPAVIALAVATWRLAAGRRPGTARHHDRCGLLPARI